MDLFLLKKIIGALLMPLPLCTIALLIAAMALVLKQRKLAKVSMGLSLTIFLISSTPFFPDYMLRKIENQYPQWDMGKGVKHIVVLGCAHTNYGPLPITSQLHPCSMIRITEAMRIFKQNPDATIITSGAKFTEAFSNAEMQKRMLIELGVPEERIVMVDGSRDTEDEARNLSPYLMDSQFALVTSASHMPRAIRLFKQFSLTPIAAPTDHKVRLKDLRPLWHLLPHSKNIQKTERWWYETLGQSWLTIKSWFN